jgi:hypothetical protein
VCRICGQTLRKNPAAPIWGTDEHHAQRKKLLGDQRGGKNLRWRGPKKVLSTGYIYIEVSSDDNIGKAMLESGKLRVAEHRLVIAHHIGRPLLLVEVVHHINYDRADNRLENLLLFPCQSEHLAHHHSLGLRTAAFKELETELATLKADRFLLFEIERYARMAVEGDIDESSKGWMGLKDVLDKWTAWKGEDV